MAKTDKSRLVVLFAIIIILLPVGYSLAGLVLIRDKSPEQPFLEMPDPHIENCVDLDSLLAIAQKR